MADSRTDMMRDIRSFFDLWNKLAAGLILTLTVLILIPAPIEWILEYFPALGDFIEYQTSDGILLVTAVYAFTTFNQMREMRWDRKQSTGMSMRPTFTDRGLELKNFGPGAALDTRLRVILREGDSICEVVDLIEDDQTVHLDEGEGFDILHGELNHLTNPQSDVFEEASAKTLEFYYTWQGRSGKQYPEDGHADIEEMDDIVDIHDEPRTVSLNELADNLTT